MRPLIAAALALVVLLAGCSGGGQSGPTATAAAADTPTVAAPAEASPSAAPTTASTPPTPGTAASRTPEAWTPPDTPGPPVEDAPRANRISEVRFFGTRNGSGFSDFDLAVYANTSMGSVDRGGDDDPRGEPYFFVWIEGEPIARTRTVAQRDEGLTTVRITPAALAGFDPGRLEVRVALLEADDDGDDRFGTWNGSVTYRPA